MTARIAGRYELTDVSPVHEFWTIGLEEFAHCGLTLSNGEQCSVDENSHPDDAECPGYGGCAVSRYVLRRHGLG